MITPKNVYLVLCEYTTARLTSFLAQLVLFFLVKGTGSCCLFSITPQYNFRFDSNFSQRRRLLLLRMIESSECGVSSRLRHIVPPIGLDVVKFARTQLNLLEAIIATKCIDFAFKSYRCEKSLISWHLRPYMHRFSIVV